MLPALFHAFLPNVYLHLMLSADPSNAHQCACFHPPLQCGRCDGYVLEGRELEFYLKKMQKKKGKQAA